MLTIGLTGGIASGKTTVSNLFSKLGVPVIDTDLISRQLLDFNQPGYQKVVDHFGEALLNRDRQIDRRRLRRIVFNDEDEKHWLEAALHPIIYQHTQQQIEQHKAAVYVIVVIPLLFEAEFQSLVNRILVIDCPAETQIKRLMARDSIEWNLAQQMLAQQWHNDARLKMADDVIHNDNDLDVELDLQVAKLHQKYLFLGS
jgi:dephospho-CoA kinase